MVAVPPNVGQGLSQVKQGLAQIGQSKAQQIMDNAGNVYTVLKDATGAATGLVVDAAGTVHDITKSAGKFLISNAMNYPQQVLQSTQQSIQEIRTSNQMIRNSLDQVGQAMMANRPLANLPPVKDALHMNAWKESLKKTGMGISNVADTFTSNVQSYVDGYSAKYCKAYQYTPPEKKLASLYGPGFKLEIGLGGCYINEASLKQKTLDLDCIKPYISWAHVPAEWISKHHSPPIFISKECKIQKTHGPTDEIVLVEFNSTTKPNMKSITDAVNHALSDSMSGMKQFGSNMVGQVTDFIGKLPNPHNMTKTEIAGLQSLVNAYQGMPQPEL